MKSIRKPRKSAMIRARCEPELVEKYQRMAYAHGLDSSDLVRLALREYAAKLPTLPCLSTT